MPAWLFIPAVLASLPLDLALSALILYGCARLLRARALTLRRAFGIAALLLAMGIVQLVLLPLPLAVRAAAGIALIAVLAALLKRAARVRWPRTLALFAFLFAANVGVNLVLGGIVILFWLKAFVMTSTSMTPTLAPGDRFLADRTLAPRRWDVVAFVPPHEKSVKWVFRIVGLPGETVEIVGGQVLINGRIAPKPVDVEQVEYGGSRLIGGLCRGGTGRPMTLGPDEFFVLGDDSQQAFDSRYWPAPESGVSQPGALPRSNIVGVVRAVYSPFGRAHWFR